MKFKLQGLFLKQPLRGKNCQKGIVKIHFSD